MLLHIDQPTFRQRRRQCFNHEYLVNEDTPLRAGGAFRLVVERHIDKLFAQIRNGLQALILAPQIGSGRGLPQKPKPFFENRQIASARGDRVELSLKQAKPRKSLKIP